MTCLSLTLVGCLVQIGSVATRIEAVDQNADSDEKIYQSLQRIH